MSGSDERTWRVAVASSDGRLIDRHLGKSDAFRIYEVGATSGARLLEERRAPAQLDRHAAHGLAALLADVDVVLASRTGPGAVGPLAAAGIQVFAVEGPVDPALAALARRGAVLDVPADRRAPAASGCAPGEGGCDCGDGCAPGREGCGPSRGGCEGCR